MSSALLVAGLTLIALFAVLVGMQLRMIRRMQAAKGKPAPTLDGPMGDWISKGNPGLFYFYSPQCGACRAMTPVVKRLAGEREGVFPIDVSQDMAVARHFQVMATPTVISVRDRAVAEVLVGAQPEAKLNALLG